MYLHQQTFRHKRLKYQYGVSRSERILKVETGFGDIFNSEKGRTSRIEVLRPLDCGLVSKRPRCRNVDART